MQIKNIKTTTNSSGKRSIENNIQPNTFLDKQAALILDSAPIGMALVAPSGKFIHVNHALCEIVGYSEEELLQMDWQSITHGGDLEVNLQYMKKLLKGKGKSFQMEKRYVHKFGHDVWVQINVTLIKDRKNKPLYTIVQIQDINERKMIEMQLKESEERYRLVQKATENVIWDWDLVNDQIHVSDNFLKTFKYDPKYISEQHFKSWWLERIHPDDRERILTAWEQIIVKNKDEHFVVEYRLLKGDGKYAHLLSQGYIFYRNGKAIRMLGAKIDITARKEAELALKQSEERYGLLFNNVSDLISIIDQDANYLFVSPSHLAIMGYTPEELVGINALSLIHPDDLPPVLAGFQQILSGGVSSAQFRVRHKKGHYVTIEGRGKAILDVYKRPYVLVITSRDISERIELERRKDRFLSRASHELKTPLTTLKAYIQLLRGESKQNVKLRGFLQKMDLQIDGLTAIVADLLDVSAMEEGTIKLHFEETHLEAVVQNTLDDLKLISKSHKFIFHSSTPIEMRIDKFRIIQVLTNLITNAVKFSPKADKINISLTQESGIAKLSVQDFGVGISKEDRAKIFDPFYQANSITLQSRMGLGLGLYIVAEIVRAHRGTIEIISEPGKGSIFIVRLPIIKDIKKSADMQTMVKLPLLS